MSNFLRSVPLTLVLLLAPLTRVVRGQQFSPRESTVKKQILKHVNSNVIIHLRDGSKMWGRITATSENMFRIKDDRSRFSRDVNFSDVTQVKSAGSLSKGAKFGILTGLLTGTVLIGLLVGMKEPAPVRH